jgi:hypothetical protein
MNFETIVGDEKILNDENLLKKKLRKFQKSVKKLKIENIKNFYENEIKTFPNNFFLKYSNCKVIDYDKNIFRTPYEKTKNL